MTTNELQTPAVADARCPHFNQIDEETLRRLFSKVAAVRSEDRQLFDFTHRRMEVFRGTNASNAEKWGEERVYRLFSSERVGNFAVVIEGEVGTGKSELCAYLSHRLRDDGRPILHIDKDDDLMSILSERIPRFYEEQFGEELPGASEFKQLRDDIQNIPQAVANNATSGAILNLRSSGYDVSPTDDQEDDIRDFVRGKLQLLVEKGEYAREIKFITKGEYKQRDELQIFQQSVGVEDAVDAFNKELWREVRNRYNTAALDDVLEHVGSEFTDTRPVIIFEDFSITAMEAKKLRNYMERDKGSDNWDFIVAGTRDSTGVLHTQTAEDRFEFFQTNERNSNSVLFLDEDTAVDFVRPYLGYIKSFDESVRYDENDAGELNLKEAPSGSICARCDFCDESFRDLFPFNQTFLYRLYTGLDESQQSPRELIMTIFEVLEEYHEGFVGAPSSASALRSLTNKISAADEVYEDAEEFADFAKWYGTVDRSDGGPVIVIDKRFADAFGLIPEDPNELPDQITIDHKSRQVLVAESGASGEVTTTPKPGTTKKKETQVEEKSVLEQTIDDHKATIDSWLDSPTDHPETDRYIKSALRDLLEELTDEYRLYEGQPLEYNLSSQKYPFVYPDGTKSPDPDQIVLDRHEFRRSDLRTLVEFGVRRVEKKNTADLEETLRKLGTQLTDYAHQWRQKIIEAYLEDDSVFYKQHARYNFTDFVLASYTHLCLLDSPWTDPTPVNLNDRFESDEEFSVDPQLRKQLKAALPPEDYDHIESAMKYADEIERMMGELLAISSGSLDVPAVRQRMERSEPYDVLTMLGRGYINNIESRVRFGTRKSLKDFAHAMYDVRRELDEISEREFDEATVETVSTELAGVDLDRITDLYESLETYDNVNPDFIEELGKFCRFSQEDIDESVDAATRATDLQGGDRAERIRAALISQKLTAMPVVNQYQNVPLEINEGGAGKGRLGGRFMEVSDHYVN
ncbi:hypothetical protein ACLI4R_15790 [Natrialbaceae archaeon A-chndr2]